MLVITSWQTGRSNQFSSRDEQHGLQLCLQHQLLLSFVQWHTYCCSLVVTQLACCTRQFMVIVPHLAVKCDDSGSLHPGGQ